MFFYVVSRTYAEIFSLLRICPGLLSNSPGLHEEIYIFTSKDINKVLQKYKDFVTLIHPITKISNLSKCFLF